MGQEMSEIIDLGINYGKVNNNKWKNKFSLNLHFEINS